MNRLRKVFTAGVMLMTIFAMTVVVSPVSAASNGDLLKIASSTTVFYYNDGVVYPFPTEKTYFTWYSNWNNVKTISMSELDSYKRGGNVTFRPGTKLITTPTTSMVYAVEPGAQLRSIVSEANAISLWGANWAQNVLDVPDSFFSNYSVKAPLTVGKYPTGTLVNTAGTMDIYYYDGSNYRKFKDEATFLSNGYSFDNIVTTKSAITAGGKEVTGVEPELMIVAGGAFTPCTGPSCGNGGSGLTVALAADTPASVVLPDGAMGVTMTKFNVTASSDGPVTIQNLSTTRTGVGTPGNISKVYIYDGASSLTTSGKTVNTTTNKSVFTNLKYVVPAGATKTLSIVVEIKANAGDNHAMGINLASDITTDGATVSGAFPVMGNVMSISNVDLGTATVTRSGSATYTRKIGEKEQVVAKFTVQTANEDSNLERLSVYNSQSDILNNMTLWRGGTKLATAVENGRYFDFALSTPNKILKGESITYTLKADITSDNADDYAHLYLKNNSDLIVIGKTYGYGVTTNIAGYNGDDPAHYTKIQLEAGDFTITSSGPSSKDVAIDVNDVTLMDVTLAPLNDTRVEQFGFDLATTGTIGDDFENVEFYCDGIGLISSDGTATASHTWSDEFDLEGGKVYECLLRVDSTSILSGGETLRATLDISDWKFRDVNTDTAFTYTSSKFNVVPSANQSGYEMTFRKAALTVASATTPASKSFVRGGKKIDMAGYTFTAGDGDDILIQDVTVTACEGTDKTSMDCGSASGNTASSVVLAAYLYEGDTLVAGPKSIDSSGQISFTDIDWTIPSSGTKTLTVKADINSSLPGSNATYVTLGLEDGAVISYYDNGNKTVTGTDPASNINTNDSGATGWDASSSIYQYFLNSGTLTVDISGNTPASHIAVAGTKDVKFSEVKLTSSNEDFIVSKMAFRNIDSSYDDNISKLYVKYPTNGNGSKTETKECTLVSGVATCTGMNAFVPNPDTSGYNNYAIVEVIADMATISEGADAADAPEFIPYLGGDWEAIGKNSGNKLYEQTVTITDVTGAGTYSSKTLATTTTSSSTSVVVDSDISSVVSVGDIICIDTDGTSTCDSDKMFVTAVSTTTMTVVRAVNGTTATGTTASGSNDGILYFNNIMTNVNPMNVQGTKLTVANQMKTKTGGQNTTEKVMEFTVTADTAGDAKIRKGKAYTGTITKGAGANFAVGHDTTHELDGSSEALTWSGSGAANSVAHFTSPSGVIDDYTRISGWLYWHDNAGSTSIDLSKIKIFTSTDATVASGQGTPLSGTLNEDTWYHFDIAMPTNTASDDINIGIELAANTLLTGGAATATGDIIALDDLMIYNEKIMVDLSINDAVTVGGSTAYLKQNGSIVAAGNTVWYDGTATSNGTLVFVPTGSYSDIEIDGTDTFTIEMDTTKWTVSSTENPNLTATIDLGNSSTAGDIYWYDVEGSDVVPYVGVNTTDKISTTITY